MAAVWPSARRGRLQVGARSAKTSQPERPAWKKYCGAGSRSPEHCANVMNPDFTQMGIAYAVNAVSEDGIYWTQVFATPR